MRFSTIPAVALLAAAATGASAELMHFHRPHAPSKPAMVVAAPRKDGPVLYCPVESDLNLDYGDNVTFDSVYHGWTILGGGRVSSKASWNLLGGYVEFDMDLTKTNPAINTNLYTISPSKPDCGADCYCDIQQSPIGKPSCMEMDIIEANANCAMATTVHTFANNASGSPDCDRGGCASISMLPGQAFHLKAAFDTNGTLTVTINGQPNTAYQPTPSQASNDVVVKTMQSIGAALASSQWFGWVPAGDKCPTGSASGLDDSVLHISNVRVSGTVVQGDEPNKC